jgi:hypothetical protein
MSYVDGDRDSRAFRACCGPDPAFRTTTDFSAFTVPGATIPGWD